MRRLSMSLEKVSLEEAIKLGFGQPSIVLSSRKPADSRALPKKETKDLKSLLMNPENEEQKKTSNK
jgi:hypothetical protein